MKKPPAAFLSFASFLNMLFRDLVVNWVIAARLPLLGGSSWMGAVEGTWTVRRSAKTLILAQRSDLAHGTSPCAAPGTAVNCFSDDMPSAYSHSPLGSPQNVVKSVLRNLEQVFCGRSVNQHQKSQRERPGLLMQLTGAPTSTPQPYSKNRTQSTLTGSTYVPLYTDASTDVY